MKIPLSLLVVLVSLLLSGAVAHAAPPEPDWSAMPEAVLDHIAQANQISLERVVTRQLKMALLHEEWVKRDGLKIPVSAVNALLTSSSQSPRPGSSAADTPAPARQDLKQLLPPREAFTPRLPSLYEDNIVTRVLGIALIVLGLFCLVLVIFGLAKFGGFAYQSLSAHKPISQMSSSLITHGTGWLMLIAVMSGAAYLIFKLLYEATVTTITAGG